MICLSILAGVRSTPLRTMKQLLYLPPLDVIIRVQSRQIPLLKATGIFGKIWMVQDPSVFRYLMHCYSCINGFCYVSARKAHMIQQRMFREAAGMANAPRVVRWLYNESESWGVSHCLSGQGIGHHNIILMADKACGGKVGCGRTVTIGFRGFLECRDEQERLSHAHLVNLVWVRAHSGVTRKTGYCVHEPVEGI